VSIGSQYLKSGRFANYVIQLSQVGMIDATLQAMIAPTGWFRTSLPKWIASLSPSTTASPSAASESGDSKRDGDDNDDNDNEGDDSENDNDNDEKDTKADTSSTSNAKGSGSMPDIVLELQENLLTDVSIVPLMAVLSEHAALGLYRLLGLKTWKNR
jgi:hypothetical protein